MQESDDQWVEKGTDTQSTIIENSSSESSQPQVMSLFLGWGHCSLEKIILYQESDKKILK